MASNSYENKKGGSGTKVRVQFDLPKGQKHSSTSSISSQDSDDIDNKDNTENFDSRSGYGSPVWSFQSGTTTTTQSPPLQFMTSPSSGYDPNRIPSSVFSNRPTSPLDWSVASNESLFSLHLGNNSFSRDNPFIFYNNNNITKSGELPMSTTTTTTTTLPTVQEVNSNDHEKNVELERHSLSSDTSEHEVEDLDVENDHKKTSLDKQTIFVVKDDDHGKTETSANVETTKLDKIHGDDYSHSKPTVVFREEPKNYATSVSDRSVESDYSNHSFQFPILTADGVRTSSETEASEKQEKIVKKHQQQHQQQQHQQVQQQQSHKPLKPPSYENNESYENEKKVPKKCCRSWCCCCCYFSCSPCSRCF